MLTELWLRLRAILGLGAGDGDLDDELAFHVEHHIEKLVASGVTRGEATRRARLDFGGIEQIKEHYRDARGLSAVEALVDYGSEIRRAGRMLAKSPAFTFVAALSLALGIGTNAALFSLHDAILLRPMPVRNPGSILGVASVTAEDRRFGGSISYPNYRDLRDKSRAFEGLLASRLVTVSFGRTRQAVRDMRTGMLVSADFFDVLGVQPALGRRFARDEGRVRGRDPVVVLGYDFWTSALSADPAILSRTIVLNNIDFTVVGVAPASFTGIEPLIRPAFFVPDMMADQLAPAGATSGSLLDDRAAHSFDVKGRLKPGTSQSAAEAELTVVWKALERQYPDANRNRSLVVGSGVQQRMRAMPLVAIQVAIMSVLAGAVLMIACANVANLMLGRARTRTREVAIRLALGISRRRLLRQLITESLLLALVGCVLGLGFAYGGIRFLSSVAQTVIPTDLPIIVDIRLDERVLVFSLLAGAVSAVAFGLAPAFQSLKTDLVSALKNAEPGANARQRTIGRNVLVVFQVALAMVLLVAAGLLVDGFRRSESLEPGFRTDHLLMMSLDTSLAQYSKAQSHDFYRELADRARRLPGAVSVALTSSIPLGQLQVEAVIPEAYELPRGESSEPTLAAAVDPGFFETMRVGLVRGRPFTADDKDTSRGVVIVNEEFAGRYWPRQEPLGKRVRLRDDRSPGLEVVGVAKNGKYANIAEGPTPFVYLPFAQHEGAQMTVLVQTAGADATPLAAPLRDVVRSLDVNQPIGDLRTFSSFYRQQAIAGRLMLMKATGAMGALGLTLSLVGL